MYINMECKQSYWEDSKPSMSLENNSYHGNIIQSRNTDNASPPMQPIHDDVCKEENSIYQYCDRNFNFSANVAGGVTSEEDDYHHTSPKRKIAVTRDPMSHRIIEKRRRDRMNNCLADLSRLIPSEYLKKGRGRIEKTEIIEMAIKHMKFLQAQICSKTENYETKAENEHHIVVSDAPYSNRAVAEESEITLQEHYKFGYQECLGEMLHFLVEVEGFYPSDTLCVKLMNHLQEYFKKIVQGDKFNRSPLGNIVLPNSYERKTNGHPSISISEMKVRSRRNSAISIHSERDSPNENINSTSQLREMLVGPHSNSFYTPSITPNIVRYACSSPEPSSPPLSSNGSLFKFKNYIQERFSAERSNLNYVRYSTENSKHTNMVENKPPTPSVVLCGNKRKAEYLTEHDPLPAASSTKEIKQIVDYYAADSKPVPIFALHAKGAFYVPLSVDSHILKPFLTELNYDYGVNGFSSSVGLHPITISVNFNRPLLSKSNEFKSLISSNISQHSSTTLHIVPECR